ncbi:MAG: hypothetical protein PHC61_00775 [Chitinivibrionales bacterium]|nr:hypothetical protein [Chitinivibrionales bacterium]
MGTVLLLLFACFFSVKAAAWSADKYLARAVSQKKLLETAADHNWSISFSKRNTPDTLMIIVLRVEFMRDSTDLTTGNGLFGLLGGGDAAELGFYKSDTVYKYDKLPHDSVYCAHQLQYAADYFKTVSRGSLVLQFRILPAGRDEDRAYAVPHQMIYYSPGGKKKSETYDDYSFRKTVGLMHFVKDALAGAGGNLSGASPFATLVQNPDGTLRDTVSGHRAAIMIMHAGSSFLTDQLQNSPADMIDWFITPQTFKFFKDSLKIAEAGVSVAGASGKNILLDEVMLTAETSNQDGLNWGVHGIIINQIARQLGIPDLFNTGSGLPAVGAFCIMDYYGYSAGNGFIPPWPSAWVRAFMGWDKPVVTDIGAGLPYRLKAVSAAGPGDTTILLVPINDHEYFLLENRQRNLGGSDTVFRYDSIQIGSSWVHVLDQTNPIKLNAAVISVSADEAHCIDSVRNYDVGVPASGVVVWHVDETVIRDRLSNNAVNADSTYRGIGLVEADGVSDMGITFANYYQIVYDVGGGADVFPHVSVSQFRSDTVAGFGPFTRPSTRANDGGQSFLTFGITPASGYNHAGNEIQAVRDSEVINYVDSAFLVSVAKNVSAPSWPKRCVPDSMFEPVACDLAPGIAGREVVAVSRHGLLYCWPATGAGAQSLGTRVALVAARNWNGDTLRDSSGATPVVAYDTVTYLDSLHGPLSFPTVINNKVYVPLSDSSLYLRSAVSEAAVISLKLPARPSSYVCNFAGTRWAVGCENGLLIFGDSTGVVDSLRLDSARAVCALAALPHANDMLAVMQVNGRISFVSADSLRVTAAAPVRGGIGPYTLAAGDLDNNDSDEVVVCDSRQGLWVYRAGGALMAPWTADPSDWASLYHEGTSTARADLPVNGSAPVLADINGDGFLDIVVGGANGIYAFNHKGALLDGWPAYLDKRYWYLRGNVRFSPAVGQDGAGKPLTVFSTMSGEHETYKLAHIIRADRQKGTIVYVYGPDSLRDSISGLRPTMIDTMLRLNDSLVPPLVLWGGFVDAVNAQAVRPHQTITTGNVGQIIESYWPFSAGAPLATGPLLANLDNSDSMDVIAIAGNGLAYRWRAPPDIVGKKALWAQTGYSAGRTFAYPGAAPAAALKEADPITFHSYPNPTQGSPIAMFKYKFSGPAAEVRLDIFTYTGFCVYSVKELSGAYPDYNEHALALDHIGPGVYRCRLAARVNGVPHVKYWKMAVVK